MLNKFSSIFILLLFTLMCENAVAVKSGDKFSSSRDIHWGEIQFTFEGICICPRWPPPTYETGAIISYWEPFLLEDTVSMANYSPRHGKFMGSTWTNKLGGKNTSSDSVDTANESTFVQAHGFLEYLMWGRCNRNDYGGWWSEYDSMWQNDELSQIIHPEVQMFATMAMSVACKADAAAVNLGYTLDSMPWCIGSGGTSYPMNGHVDNDNIVQANNTAASRLIYKLNRVGMICDPTPLCGCRNTPVWVKSHYKLHVARPANRSPAYPVGKSSKFYDSGLNPPYRGSQGSNDEFLWVVYRKQRCCTCCEK